MDGLCHLCISSLNALPSTNLYNYSTLWLWIFQLPCSWGCLNGFVENNCSRVPWHTVKMLAPAQHQNQRVKTLWIDTRHWIFNFTMVSKTTHSFLQMEVSMVKWAISSQSEHKSQEDWLHAFLVTLYLQHHGQGKVFCFNVCILCSYLSLPFSLRIIPMGLLLTLLHQEPVLSITSHFPLA